MTKSHLGNLLALFALMSVISGGGLLREAMAAEVRWKAAVDGDFDLELVKDLFPRN